MDGLMLSVQAAQRPGEAESIAAANGFTFGLHSPARHRHGVAAQRRGRRTFLARAPEHTWPNTPLDEAFASVVLTRPQETGLPIRRRSTSTAAPSPSAAPSAPVAPD